MSQKKIIIVDDETGIRQLVKQFLQRHHYEVYEAGTAAKLYEIMTRVQPDLIVLDLMLPDEYGIDICKKIRKSHDVPIVMLTAVQGETNTVLGFEAGADDYVEKPFSAHVLLSRIQAILRRRQSQEKESKASSPVATLTNKYVKALFGSWSYHPQEAMLKHINGQHLFLTKNECHLLEIFLANENIILTRDQLMQAMGFDWHDAESRAIDVQISRLRSKLKDKSQTNYIKSLRNKGYLLALPVRLVYE